MVEAVIVPRADGELTATLTAVRATGLQLAGESSQHRSVRTGDTLHLIWKVTLPSICDGRLSDLTVVIAPSDPHASIEFAEGESRSLYADVAKGQVLYSGSEPEVGMVTPPRGISMKVDKSEHARSPQSAPTTIHVNITGRVTAQDVRGILHGVSNVRVYFDWDADEDVGTFQVPVYDGVSDTAQYAIADVDGNFTFSRQVTAENDSWVWNVHRIRLYATAWNDAAYFKGWGENAVFSEPPSQQVAFTITPAAPDITAMITDWEVARDQGMALRYLWRARQFTIEDFWLTPPRVRFDLWDNGETSFFTPGVPVLATTTITFNGFPTSNAAYHEYGHYAHFLWAGIGRFPATENCGAHSYPLVTNDACAMVEGWAEFYCAATHTFWYERERPTIREPDGRDDPRTQFLDRNYGEIPANNGDCEGGVARFLFNLWDGIALRSPGTPTFTGDNEDLYHANYGDRNGGHPHQWLLYTLKDIFQYKQVVTIPNGVRQVREAPFIDVFRRRYFQWVDSWFPFTSFYHHQSIDASYNRMTTLADELRAATPTVLNVAGDEFQRTLTWNDNTEPQSIVYPQEGASDSDPIELANNNEAGFAVWRRTLTFIPRPLFAPNDPAIFDGRLDATCQLIGLVPPDVHTFVDHQYLGSGDHEYVVVAYRRLNNTVPELLSIPLAQGSIRLRGVDIRGGGGDPIHPIILPSHHDDLTATSSTRANPAYRWIASNTPVYITLSGMNTQTLTITNNYQPGVGYLPGEMHPFSVRCIVSDVSGADTSLPYYPAYTPLDTASAFVRVHGASGVVADADLERGMDFVTQPQGDVTSVHLLSTAPVKDSAGHYVIELDGMAHGTLAFNHARLLALAHPADTRIGGTAWSGYHVEREVGGVWSEDTTRPYGAEELPLVVAAHTRLGDVTALLAEHDSLAALLGGGERLTLRFGDPVWVGDTVGVVDSLATESVEGGWVREYLLELRGVYAPNAAVGARAAGVAGVAGIAGYALEGPAPNPARGRVLLRYRLGSEGGTRIDLLNERGEIVQRLAMKEEGAGDHAMWLDVSGLASGMCFCRVTSGMLSGVRAIAVVG